VYPKYFGLKEPSFSITPDPQYLFLSGQHREALAHLLYGAGDGGGFVLLSGEVGTGKTTVCRAFLEQLPEDVDVALVVNPAMTASELLHAVCDEFRVELPPGEPSVKAMLDHLNRFLLDAHARGRRPVLIIDEAQNLRPKVLEQIRLLTNLETAKQKLLQIFLIGQPELRTLLASPDLRQLNQRITARYHLKPLSAREAAAYVEHRISVAGVDRPLFTPRALTRVHRRSGGVPRLINLLCDRALLGAAVSRRLQVTPDIVDAAAREVIDARDPALPRRRNTLGLAAAVTGALAFGVWLGASDLPRQLPAQLPAHWLAAVGWSQLTSPAPRIGAAKSAAAGVAETAPVSASATPVDQILDQATEQQDPRPLDAAAMTGTEDGGREPAGARPAPADAAMAVARTADPSASDTPEPELSIEPERPAPSSAATAADGQAATADPTTSTAAAETRQPTAALRTPRIAMAHILPAADGQIRDTTDLADALVAEDSVVDELLRLWRIQPAAGARHLDCAAVPAFALDCERSDGRWSDLRRFDRPAALKLKLAEGETGFVVIGGLNDEHALVHRDTAALRVPIAVLDERWSGDYLLLWRPPPQGGRIIGKGSSADAIAWLRERLALLPDSEITVDPARYDAAVVEAVRGFQQMHGLASDGIAGPRTLIMLSNALADLDVPRLSHSH
jgi:general secretion pathway protein A